MAAFVMIGLTERIRANSDPHQTLSLNMGNFSTLGSASIIAMLNEPFKKLE